MGTFGGHVRLSPAALRAAPTPLFCRCGCWVGRHPSSRSIAPAGYAHPHPHPHPHTSPQSGPSAVVRHGSDPAEPAGGANLAAPTHAQEQSMRGMTNVILQTTSYGFKYLADSCAQPTPTLARRAPPERSSAAPAISPHKENRHLPLRRRNLPPAISPV